MVSWWWVAPALVAFIGALVLLNGLASLFRGRIVGGVFKIIGGGVVLASMLAVTLLAQNIQTWSRLTYERPVATVQPRRLAQQYFEVTVIQSGLIAGPPTTRRETPRRVAGPASARPNRWS